MATQAFQPRKKSASISSQTSPEELIRLLIAQISRGGTDGSSPERQGHGETEEIIFDVTLEGFHYLLVRLPAEARRRVQLSPREQEIVRMVARGHSNKIIADVLNISSWTVCTHMRRIFAKLGVGSRAAMVARILEIRESREPSSLYPANDGGAFHSSRVPDPGAENPGRGGFSREKPAPQRIR